MKGEDGISCRKAAIRNWRHESETICRRNVLTPGSIRSCGTSRMLFPAARRPAPVVRAIHWTVRSWALAFSLGTSTLAQGTELVAADGQKSARPVFSRPLAYTPSDTRRGIKSGNRHLARFLSPPGDRPRPPHLACRGVLSKWQTRCLLTRLTLRRRG